MGKEITESTMQKALEFAYDKAVNGVVGLDSAQELAESYMKEKGSKIEQANSLIRWQNTKSGTSGFITGFGGLIVMPVTLPANITSVIFIQIRMVAAIAYIGGHDIKSDKVKTLIYTSLLGNAAKEVLKDVGIQVSKKIAINLIKQIPGKVITKINQKVGFRLVTKFGEKGIINLAKAVPILGGIVGGTLDVASTNTVGNTARDIFIGKK
ncbi:MAG TPA: EcsC family protein [Campylobacterales bacterium]|nr:EcsC family protein [Campylobacterales bacterium]